MVVMVSVGVCLEVIILPVKQIKLIKQKGENMYKTTTYKEKYIPMTRQVFVDTINAIKDYHTKINNIQTVLEENCQDSVFWPPSLEDTLVNVLIEVFNDDPADIITYYIYELEFGEKWESGMITDNEQDIKLKTPEDLYDYLISGLNM